MELYTTKKIDVAYGGGLVVPFPDTVGLNEDEISEQHKKNYEKAERIFSSLWA